MNFDAAEIGRRGAGGVVLRPGGVRVRWEMSDLYSADGQSLRAVFSAALKPLSGAADQQMFEETFLGRASTVSTDDVAAHFRPSLESAARRYAGGADLQSLLSESGRAAMAGKLADAARAVAFNCGLDLLPPLELELDSPTLLRQQEETRRAAAQAQRFASAADLFGKFEEIRRKAPDMTADQIFQRIGGADPAERVQTLRLLLMASARQAGGAALWAVAGPHLLKIEPLDSSDPPRCRMFTPPPLLGPFRSVQRGELNGKTVLLIGARSGVLVIDPSQPNEAAAYADPAITSSLGFNAAAISGGKLWASHGEAGVVGWDVEQRDTPSVAVRPAGFVPRNLSALDGGRLVFTSDHRLFEVFPDGVASEVDTTPGAAVLCMIRESNGSLLIVHEDGQLCRRDGLSLKITQRARRTGQVSAACGLPWLGSTRLLLATESGPLQCVALDDELMTQYVSVHSGARLAAAAADRVAAVSADRQRIVLWPSWDGREPAGEVHVAAIARHRVADVEFA